MNSTFLNLNCTLAEQVSWEEARVESGLCGETAMEVEEGNTGPTPLLRIYYWYSLKV
jgi:hypothetical protein